MLPRLLHEGEDPLMDRHPLDGFVHYDIQARVDGALASLKLKIKDPASAYVQDLEATG
jgi:hypothetical protein